MAGKPWEKTKKDNLRVWNRYWELYKAAGKQAQYLRKVFEEQICLEVGYEPQTIRRKINKMLKHTPSPC